MADTNENTALEQAREQMQRQVIAQQNDAFRQALGVNAFWHAAELLGRCVTTPGFRELPAEVKRQMIVKVMNFNTFTEENDPWEDHSFGVVEEGEHKIFWKIDLYDTAYSYGVGELDDAADPEKCRRVLTLYLPIEH